MMLMATTGRINWDQELLPDRGAAGRSDYPGRRTVGTHGLGGFGVGRDRKDLRTPFRRRRRTAKRAMLLSELYL